MDEQYAQLQMFYRELDTFNQHLRESMRDTERCHEAVDGLWRDDFRKDYEAQWGSYRQTMQSYSERGALAYEQFLQDQLRNLERYLFGH